MSSLVGLKTFAITTRIAIYKSIIKKNTKEHNNIVLLARTKLNTIEVLIFIAWIDLYINHDEFILVNDVLKKYKQMKEEIKNQKSVPVARYCKQKLKCHKN